MGNYVYYRGGPKLNARIDEVKLERSTNRLKSSHGVSVYNRSDHHNLNAHGGAYTLGSIPIQLRVIQRGKDTSHYEIVPAQALALTFEEYQEYLDQIVLTRVDLRRKENKRGD